MDIINKDFKILVVDDSPEILDITTRPLIKANYHVFSAKDGAQCLEIFHQEKPDIILLDVMLPDANGIELAKEIKKNHSVYIILLSALKTSYEDVSEGLEEGADGYMIRPINSRELLARVNSACRIVKAEREINQKNNELIKLNNEKDKFFSIIAHDLKSPFNAIIGFSDILVTQIHKNNLEKINQHASSIQQSSHRAMELLTNLMEWTQSQTGRINFSPVNFELVDLINDAVALLNDSAVQKLITIGKNLPPSLIVFGDKAMTSTILRNLISNAIKFTKSGGSIIISASKNQNEVTISVKDSGVGISKTRIEKLFSLDESSSTTGTNKEKGTGLGLILCKEFVEKHKGKIWVESEEGIGSAFYFTIPCSNNKEKVIKQNTVIATKIDKKAANLKILIAEDDDVSEILIATYVAEFGKEILIARTGVEAVEACKNNPDIDLVLMDIRMPKMDGHEATQQIREFNKDVVIIAQTAYGLAGDKELAIDAGCNDYIAKPISMNDLKTLIRKYFE